MQHIPYKIFRVTRLVIREIWEVSDQNFLQEHIDLHVEEHHDLPTTAKFTVQDFVVGRLGCLCLWFTAGEDLVYHVQEEIVSQLMIESSNVWSSSVNFIFNSLLLRLLCNFFIFRLMSPLLTQRTLLHNKIFLSLIVSVSRDLLIPIWSNVLKSFLYIEFFLLWNYSLCQLRVEKEIYYEVKVGSFWISLFLCLVYYLTTEIVDNGEVIIRKKKINF